MFLVNMISVLQYLYKCARTGQQQWKCVLENVATSEEKQWRCANVQQNPQVSSTGCLSLTALTSADLK
jgi:hypothetical protein